MPVERGGVEFLDGARVVIERIARMVAPAIVHERA